MDVKREACSPTRSPQGLKDYSVKEPPLNKQEDARDYSVRLTTSSSENCCLHHDRSPVLQHNGLTNTLLLHPPISPSCMPQCNRFQYMNAPFFSSNENLSCHKDNGSCTEIHDFNSLPPPLPPKKYSRNTVPRNEKNFAPSSTATLSETLSYVHSASTEKLSGDLERPTHDIDYYPAKDTFQIEMHTPHSSGSSAYDYRAKMIQPPLGLDPVSHVNDTVSLTTYFSVDNCMTDTYRQKYHQKPKVYMTESTAFHRDPGHIQLPESLMEPSCHKTLENPHHSIARTKMSYGTIPCNR